MIKSDAVVQAIIDFIEFEFYESMTTEERLRAIETIRMKLTAVEAKAITWNKTVDLMNRKDALCSEK